jgi:DNA-binding beta-propeller fold protein YncE
MQSVKELQRRRSPGGRPQPLAFLNGQLWVGAWENPKLYAIDPKEWSVSREVDPPGKPFGMAAVDDSLFIVVALEDDDRYLYRFTLEGGFDENSKRPCPDFTGSHLASNGSSLYLCQQGRQRILLIDENAQVQREIALPTRCAGVGFDASGRCIIISADEEFEELALAQLDVTQSAPAAEPIAPLPFDGRALTYDGNAWWSSEREAGEIIAFSVA